MSKTHFTYCNIPYILLYLPYHPLRWGQLLVSFPFTPPHFTNHIIIYSTQPDYFPNNFYPLLLWTSSPISFHFRFTYLVDYLVIIRFLLISPNHFIIISHFSSNIHYSYTSSYVFISNSIKPSHITNSP